MQEPGIVGVYPLYCRGSLGYARDLAWRRWNDVHVLWVLHGERPSVDSVRALRAKQSSFEIFACFDVKPLCCGSSHSTACSRGGVSGFVFLGREMKVLGWKVGDPVLLRAVSAERMLLVNAFNGSGPVDSASRVGHICGHNGSGKLFISREAHMLGWRFGDLLQFNLSADSGAALAISLYAGGSAVHRRSSPECLKRRSSFVTHGTPDE